MTPLQRVLERSVEHDQLVGAQLTVLSGGVAQSAVAGVQDAVSGQPMTERTRLEIGSVTKPLVAAALLLAQEDGLVDLEAPVADRVPEFRPDDPSARGVTARQVLSHTSGLAGDYFPDTGEGPEAIASFVSLLARQPLDVAPGTTVSYSNAAYVLAGRLLERVTGRSFPGALAQRLLDPAGVERIATWSTPEADIARGHELDRDGRPVHARRRFPRALAPAGGVVSPARDLADLVRSMTVVPAGELPSWLPERSRERIAEVADRPGTSLGWGWAVSASHDELLLAHDGGTFGASSYVRVLPERDLVVVLLTARSGVGSAGHRLVDAALAALGHPPIGSPQAGELARAVRGDAAVVGSYRRTGGGVDVQVHGSGLHCTLLTSDVESGGTRQEGRLELQPSGAWHAHLPGGPLPLVFLGDQDRATVVVTGARAHTRIS